MFSRIALEGFWLLGGLATAYLVGVFTAQWAKDKLSGVPSELRAALAATESAALAELGKAKAAIVADVGSLFAKANPPATPAAPAAAPAAQPAAPQAQPTAPAAPAASATGAAS